jgi:hypothetical protein
MTVEDLKYAIDDAQTFVDRAKTILENTTNGTVEAKHEITITRLGLNVKRALTDLMRKPE